MEDQERRKCPLCGKDVPTEPSPDGGEVPVFKSHAVSFGQGPCTFSGEPIDTNPADLFDDPEEEDEDDGVREGHGKPSKPLGGEADG